jgi:hypothetical protein
MNGGRPRRVTMNVRKQFREGGLSSPDIRSGIGPLSEVRRELVPQTPNALPIARVDVPIHIAPL